MQQSGVIGSEEQAPAAVHPTTMQTEEEKASLPFVLPLARDSASAHCAEELTAGFQQAQHKMLKFLKEDAWLRKNAPLPHFKNTTTTSKS